MPDTSGSQSAYLSGSGLQAAHAGAYVEVGGKTIRAAQAGAYIEVGGKRVQVVHVGAYIEVPPADTSSYLSAYLTGPLEATDSLDAYLEGETGAIPASDSQSAFLWGRDTETDSLSAFLWAPLVDNLPCYLSGGTAASASTDAYTRGKTTTQSSTPAYTASGYKFSSIPAYLYGYARSSLAAYLYSGTKVTTSLDAFIRSEVDTTNSLDAFLKAHDLAASTRPAYLMSGTSTSASLSAYMHGNADTENYWYAYLKGQNAATSSVSAYLSGGTATSSSISAYLSGIPQVETSIPCWTEGTVNFVRTSKPAYAEGIPSSIYWQTAFLRGSTDIVDDTTAFLGGKISTSASTDAYLEGGPQSTVPAYLRGKNTASDNLEAYVFGGTAASSSIEAYIEGYTTSSIPAYAEGYPTYFPDPVDIPAYTEGAYGALGRIGKVWMQGGISATPSSLDAYLYGHIGTDSSTGAYTRGIVADFRGSMKAFIGPPVERSSLSCFTEGLMTEYAYIILENSNASLSEKFRVVAEGYDDGSLEKSVSINKTIGGGVDVAMGDVYTTWNPIIRVRHTETESGYGNLSDLETFYGYNDPGGTPTNVITFTDNHGVGYSTYMVGNFKKQYLGARIEGSDAWLFVKLILIEKV
jgi:hypothetical protein